MSALFVASGYGQRELVKLLLKHGANVDLEDDVRGNNTPTLVQGLSTPYKGRRGHLGNV